ncbi:unnamed protein product [Cyprideis torosa]|uniref:Uncharacterized protein n=1 Tax=Cyprideis torosa TaxID=163714 RepID=A0A7R8W9D7_9CRUS|nr:unnamed protein product [Cyprideis torosa]CAG0884752.1 unnamed protein product [Cyprideis torosa]
MDRRTQSLIFMAHASDVLENAFAPLRDEDYEVAIKRSRDLLELDPEVEAAKPNAFIGVCPLRTSVIMKRSLPIAALCLLLSSVSSNSTTATEGQEKSKPVLTGIPQKDYVHDPNLPRELNGNEALYKAASTTTASPAPLRNPYARRIPSKRPRPTPVPLDYDNFEYDKPSASADLASLHQSEQRDFRTPTVPQGSRSLSSLFQRERQHGKINPPSQLTNDIPQNAQHITTTHLPTIATPVSTPAGGEELPLRNARPAAQTDYDYDYYADYELQVPLLRRRLATALRLLRRERRRNHRLRQLLQGQPATASETADESPSLGVPRT